MVTTISDNSLGKLRVFVDWNTDTLYLSAKDLALMLQASIHDYLMEQFNNDLSTITTIQQGTIYFNATAVMTTISKIDNPRFKQVYDWLKPMFLQQHLPSRWWTYFNQRR